jgi:hypothetical protein
MGHVAFVDVTLNSRLPVWNVHVGQKSITRSTQCFIKQLGGMPKQKPAERIINILRLLSKNHPEQTLGSHIALATEEAALEGLSDRAFLDYLLSYENNVAPTQEEYYQEDDYYAE